MEDREFKKVLYLLSVIKKNYDAFELKFSKEKIYKESIPLKTSEKCDEFQKEKIEKGIEKLFYPIFDAVSPLIDAGFIDHDSVGDELFKPLNLEKAEDISNVVYEGLDKLYINKVFFYFQKMNYIMNLYVLFEKEFTSIVNKNNLNTNSSLWKSLDYYESEFNYIVCTSDKKIIDKYRNIINVYKHGYGSSYINLEKNYPNIFNFKITSSNENAHFIFKIEILDFFELHKIFEKILNRN